MVVKIQPGISQTLCLIIIQHAQRHAGFQPQFFYAAHHLFQIRHIAIMGIFPRRAHTKTPGTGGFGLPCGIQHGSDFHQSFSFQSGFITRTLGTIFAVLRAGAGFDRQQRADLDLARIKVLTMDLLRFKQQIQQWLIEQRLCLCTRPAIFHFSLPKGLHLDEDPEYSCKLKLIQFGLQWKSLQPVMRILIDNISGIPIPQCLNLYPAIRLFLLNNVS